MLNTNAKLPVSCKSLLFGSLLVVVLVSSCFVSVYDGVSFFVLGASDKIVSNEKELRSAINSGLSKKITIALDNDITLENKALIIPADKDITLTSNKASKYYKLIGTPFFCTIEVEAGGVLRLDGIVVTHANGDFGMGLYVHEEGRLVMYSGEISGNNAGQHYDEIGYAYEAQGGGVINRGTFEMYDGVISNNNVHLYGSAGGVIIAT